MTHKCNEEYSLSAVDAGENMDLFWMQHTLEESMPLALRTPSFDSRRGRILCTTMIDVPIILTHEPDNSMHMLWVLDAAIQEGPPNEFRGAVQDTPVHLPIRELAMRLQKYAQLRSGEGQEPWIWPNAVRHGSMGSIPRLRSI